MMKKQNVFFELLAWFIQAQLIFSPSYVLAAEKEAKTAKTKKAIKDTELGKTVSDLYKGYQAVGGSRALGSMNGGGAMMSMPEYAPKFTNTDDYFGRCRLLQEKTDFAGMAMCNIQSQTDLNRWYAYQAQAEINVNLYDNYDNPGLIRNINGMTANDNANGLKCMSSQREELEKLFNSRLDQIDDFINTIDKQSEIASNTLEKEYLRPLKDMQARLHGNSKGSSQFDNSEFQNLFSFESSPACGSLAGTDFQELGGSKGLMGIRDNLNAQFEAPIDHGGESYSPKRYLQAKGEIVESIKKGAAQIAADIQRKIKTGSQIEAEDLTKIENTGFNLSGVESLRVAIASNTKVYNDLTSEIDDLGKSNVDALLINAAKDPNADFSKVRNNYENGKYYACMDKHFSDSNRFSGLSSFISSIQLDPRNSFKGATVKAKIEMNSLLTDFQNNDITLTEFMKRLESMKVAGAYIKGGLNGLSISPKETLKTALNFCNAEYNRVPGGAKYSQKQAADMLAKKASQVRSKAGSLANDVQTSILNRVISCDGMKSKGQTANSCSKSSFDPTSSSFCVNGATKCAANVNVCLSQTKSKVSEIENARKSLIDGPGANGRPGLKAVVNNQKRSIDILYNQLEAQVRSLSTDLKNKMPGVNEFPIPAIFTHTEEDKKFLLGDDKNLPESLRVEDPVAYMERLKEHVTGPKGMRASIEAQKESTLKGLDEYTDKLKKAYQEQIAFWQNEMGRCNEAAKSFADANKEQADELNEHYVACMSVPTGDDDQNVQYLSEDTIKILEKLGARGAGRQLASIDGVTGINLEKTTEKELKESIENLREQRKSLSTQNPPLSMSDLRLMQADFDKEIKEYEEMLTAKVAYDSLKRTIKEGTKESCKKINDQMIAFKEQNSGGSAGAAAANAFGF